MVTPPCKSGTTSCARTKSKPEVGHCKKAGAPALRHLEEFRLRDEPTYEVGAQINVSELFKEGDKVDARQVHR